MGLQIVENLPLHSRILASTGKVRQAARRMISCGWASSTATFRDGGERGVMRKILAVVALSLPLCCIAGRPVFNDLSLDLLARSADIVAVVSKSQPFEETTKDKFGCDWVRWHLTVKDVLKKQRPDYPEAGSPLVVLANTTSVQDCTLREGWRTAGASFSASRYSPSDPTAITKQQFIVFLVMKNGVLELVSDNAFEAINRKGDVESLLDQ